MNAFHGRGMLLAALAGLIYTQAATAQDLTQPALLPPASLQGPFAGQPLAHSETNPAQSLDLSTLSGAPATTDLIPQPGIPASTGTYDAALRSSWGSDGPSCDVPSCTSPVCGSGCCYAPCWFGSVGGLIMQRDHRSQFQASFDTGTGLTVLETCDVQPPVAGGIDVTVGKWFCGGQWGLGFTYWGAYPTTQTAEAFGAGMVGALNTNFDFTGLDYSNGVTTSTINDWFDDAQHHEIRHRNEFHSVELNFLGGNNGYTPWGGGASCSNFGYGWTLGMRYFRFNDDFALLSDDADIVFNGGVDEVTYDLRTQNDLLGFQLGGGLSYRLWKNLSVFGMAKAGLYGVNARQEQFLGGTNGLAVVNTGAFTGQVYDIHAASTDLAMLGQMDLGGSWQISQRWSAQIAYRFVGIGGVALVNDQIPNDFTNLAQAREINTNGSVILHGAFIGATYAY